MPDLSPEEVDRFVAFGKQGRELLESGDANRAEAAFRAQIAIFTPNPAPHLSLAFLEADRGNREAAMQHLQDAVVRGFTDLREVVRAEAWTGMGRPIAYLKLLDALPGMIELERKWPEWDTSPFTRTPTTLDEVRVRLAQLVGKIDAMAPALGETLTRLWHRTIDRGTAARLEAWLAVNPEAEDSQAAFEDLMTIYAGGPLQRWDRLSAAASRRLIETANGVLRRFPASEMRPAALVALAIGKNAVRDKQGVLNPQAAKQMREALAEVVTEHPDSPTLATAVVGLVRTEAATGRSDSAERHYLDFRAAHAEDRALLDRVQDDLGELALRIGGLPDFRAITLDGRTVEPQTLRGKVAVVDFWATWCGPCVEELPALRKIDRRYGEDVVLLGVNLNEAGELSAAALRDWIAREQVPGDQVHDGLSWDSELVRVFGVKEIPFNVVVGPDGEVLAVNQQGKKLEKTVRAALQTP